MTFLSVIQYSSSLFLVHLLWLSLTRYLCSSFRLSFCAVVFVSLFKSVELSCQSEHLTFYAVQDLCTVDAVIQHVLKDQCHEKSMAFYNIRCCFRTEQRSTNWFLYIGDPLSATTFQNGVITTHVKPDQPELALTRTPFWNAPVSISVNQYTLRHFNFPPSPSLRSATRQYLALQQSGQKNWNGRAVRGK